MQVLVLVALRYPLHSQQQLITQILLPTLVAVAAVETQDQVAVVVAQVAAMEPLGLQGRQKVGLDLVVVAVVLVLLDQMDHQQLLDQDLPLVVVAAVALVVVAAGIRLKAHQLITQLLVVAVEVAEYFQEQVAAAALEQLLAAQEVPQIMLEHQEHLLRQVLEEVVGVLLAVQHQQVLEALVVKPLLSTAILSHGLAEILLVFMEPWHEAI